MNLQKYQNVESLKLKLLRQKVKRNQEDYSFIIELYRQISIDRGKRNHKSKEFRGIRCMKLMNLSNEDLAVIVMNVVKDQIK